MATGWYSPQQLQGVLKRAVAPWSNNYTATVLGNAANNVEARAAEREEDLEARALDQSTNYQKQMLGYQSKGLDLESKAQDMLNKYLNVQLANTKQGSSDTDTAGKLGIAIGGLKTGWDIGTSKGMENIVSGINNWISPSEPTLPSASEVSANVTAADLAQYAADEELLKWLASQTGQQVSGALSEYGTTAMDMLSGWF